MKYRKELLPALFLGSGTALTVCGLAIMVAYGVEAPIAALALLLAGLLDGVTGLIWTVAVLFSRREETPERIDEARRGLVLASGLLAVVFLGAVLALLLYLHVIVVCLRSWRLL
jgi:hypothetical protein